MLSGPITILSNDDRLKDETKQLIYIVQRSVNRMLRLVNQLMDFNKLENDTLKLKVKTIDIISELNRTIDIFKLNAKEKEIDIRLVSASNKDLLHLVDDNLFREDLLYRLNTIELTIPPLRERGEDIIELAEYFVHKYSKQYQKQILKINSDSYNKLLQHNWPGNVRELKHTVEKAVILCEKNVLSPSDFFSNDNTIKKQVITNIETLAEAERMVLEKALKKAGGNLSQAAKILDISRSTLYSKMSKYGL